MSQIRRTKGWQFLRGIDTQFQENAKKFKQAEAASKPNKALAVGFAIYEPTYKAYHQISAPLGDVLDIPTQGKMSLSSSSPEPLGQFQPILAQNILGLKIFIFLQMNNQTVFKKRYLQKSQILKICSLVRKILGKYAKR